MTLAQLRAAHPDLFHPNQDWFVGEAFMHTEADRDATLPDGFIACGPGLNPFALINLAAALHTAATLAALYVRDPSHPIWDRYLWTRDKDALGQRVYVGDNGKGLELHRHLHITDRFGVPTWN